MTSGEEQKTPEQISREALFEATKARQEAEEAKITAQQEAGKANIMAAVASSKVKKIGADMVKQKGAGIVGIIVFIVRIVVSIIASFIPAPFGQLFFFTSPIAAGVMMLLQSGWVPYRTALLNLLYFAPLGIPVGIIAIVGAAIFDVVLLILFILSIFVPPVSNIIMMGNKLTKIFVPLPIISGMSLQFFLGIILGVGVTIFWFLGGSLSGEGIDLSAITDMLSGLQSQWEGASQGLPEEIPSGV